MNTRSIATSCQASRSAGRALVVVLGAAVGLVGLTSAESASAAPSVSAAQTPACFGEAATIVDQREGAEVRGTPGPDVIVVRAEAVVHAGAGDDLICGHGNLWGEAGDDRISMRWHRSASENSYHPSAFGGPGDDVIHRDDPYLPDAHLYSKSDGGPGDDILVGSPNPDRFTGGPGNDRLRGLGGPSLLDGGFGTDALVGGHSPDRLFGGPGPDRVRSGGGKDRAFGAEGNDLILGGEGADLAEGSIGDDRILGQQGVDVADGGPGQDVCHAETVRDCQP